VHLGEFHNLEGLARDNVYRFVYLAMTNRVRGAAAGFAMRPIAIQWRSYFLSSRFVASWRFTTACLRESKTLSVR